MNTTLHTLAPLFFAACVVGCASQGGLVRSPRGPDFEADMAKFFGTTSADRRASGTARLSPADVSRIAEEFLLARGTELHSFIPSEPRFRASGRPGCCWFVFYDAKYPERFGDYFTIQVNDRSRHVTYIPGL
jgi:hypothetical protein